MPWSSPASPQLPRWLLLHRDVLLKKKKKKKGKAASQSKELCLWSPFPWRMSMPRGVRCGGGAPASHPSDGMWGGRCQTSHCPVFPKSVCTTWGGSLSDLGQQDICSILKVFLKWKQRPLFVSLLHQQLLNSSLIYEPGCYKCLHPMLLAQVDV